MPAFLQGSGEGSAIKDFVLKHTLPLVGHRKPSNDAKRYTRRPLVVVYYSVDFSFDYRAGEGGPWGRAGVWLPPGFRWVSFRAPGRQGSRCRAQALGLVEVPPRPLLTKVPFSETLFPPIEVGSGGAS